MSSPKRYLPDPIDQDLKFRLRKWAASQPLPRNGRARLLKEALRSRLPGGRPVKNLHFIYPSANFNWTATYLAGDKLLRLRLVS